MICFWSGEKYPSPARAKSRVNCRIFFRCAASSLCQSSCAPATTKQISQVIMNQLLLPIAVSRPTSLAVSRPLHNYLVLHPHSHFLRLTAYVMISLHGVRLESQPYKKSS